MKPTILLGGVAALAVAALPASADDAAPSRFLDQVRAATFAPAPPVEGALRWDFSRSRLLIYRLRQSTHRTTIQEVASERRRIEQEIEGEGVLLARGEDGEATARFRIEDGQIRFTTRVGEQAESGAGATPPQMSHPVGPDARPAMPEGEAPGWLDNLLATAFALPPDRLSPGQDIELPLEMGAGLQWGPGPGRMQAFPVVARGTVRVRHGGYEDVDGASCVRLDIHYQAVQETRPKGYPGDAVVRFRGEARTWFDPVRARVAATRAAMVMRIDTRTSMGPVGSGAAELNAEVVSDTLVEARLGR